MASTFYGPRTADPGSTMISGFRAGLDFNEGLIRARAIMEDRQAKETAQREWDGIQSQIGQFKASEQAQELEFATFREGILKKENPTTDELNDLMQRSTGIMQARNARRKAESDVLMGWAGRNAGNPYVEKIVGDRMQQGNQEFQQEARALGNLQSMTSAFARYGLLEREGAADRATRKGEGKANRAADLKALAVETFQREYAADILGPDGIRAAGEHFGVENAQTPWDFFPEFMQQFTSGMSGRRAPGGARRAPAPAAAPPADAPAEGGGILSGLRQIAMGGGMPGGGRERYGALPQEARSAGMAAVVDPSRFVGGPQAPAPTNRERMLAEMGPGTDDVRIVGGPAPPPGAPTAPQPRQPMQGTGEIVPPAGPRQVEPFRRRRRRAAPPPSGRELALQDLRETVDAPADYEPIGVAEGRRGRPAPAPARARRRAEPPRQTVDAPTGYEQMRAGRGAESRGGRSSPEAIDNARVTRKSRITVEQPEGFQELRSGEPARGTRPKARDVQPASTRTADTQRVIRETDAELRASGAPRRLMVRSRARLRQILTKTGVSMDEFVAMPAEDRAKLIARSARERRG